MAEDQTSRETPSQLRPDDHARRIDELIREAEQAVLNTKRFLQGIQESNVDARQRIGEMRERFEKNLRSLRRLQEQEDQI